MAFSFKRIYNSIKGLVTSVLPIGATTDDLFDREAARLKNAVADSVRQGYVRQSPLSEVLSSVRQGFKTTQRNVKTIVKTAANSVTNIVREAAIEANPDKFRGYVHLSILDTKTSNICISRSGLKWDMNKKPVGHNKPFKRPALHYNCRSKLIPWVKGQKNSDLPKSYQEWLRGQTKAVQVEALGPSRWKMWKNGSLSLRQLVNQDGRPKTLAELRKR